MDPADEFHTPYAYVAGDPVNLVDPDGRQAAQPGCEADGPTKCNAQYSKPLDKSSSTAVSDIDIAKCASRFASAATAERLTIAARYTQRSAELAAQSKATPWWRLIRKSKPFGGQLVNNAKASLATKTSNVVKIGGPVVIVGLSIPASTEAVQNQDWRKLTQVGVGTGGGIAGTKLGTFVGTSTAGAACSPGGPAAAGCAVAGAGVGAAAGGSAGATGGRFPGCLLFPPTWPTNSDVGDDEKCRALERRASVFRQRCRSYDWARDGNP